MKSLRVIFRRRHWFLDNLTPAKLLDYLSLGPAVLEVDISSACARLPGDPFAHPEIDAICRAASEAGLNVHLTTSFSFELSDDRIAWIARSGVTHLTIVVDGFSHETYGTRIGGDLSRVLSNLERLCAYKKAHDLRFPRIEIHYIELDHNLHELPQALAYFERLGLENVETLRGIVSAYAELGRPLYG